MGSGDAVDRLDSTIERVETVAAEAVAGASSAAAIARSVDIVHASSPRRPATLVDLASDGCKYGVGVVAVEESDHATARTIHVFCNRPRFLQGRIAPSMSGSVAPTSIRSQRRTGGRRGPHEKSAIRI
jgi:hypothetical protein